jgi:hypothetical protein
MASNDWVLGSLEARVAKAEKKDSWGLLAEDRVAEEVALSMASSSPLATALQICQLVGCASSSRLQSAWILNTSLAQGL